MSLIHKRYLGDSLHSARKALRTHIQVGELALYLTVLREKFEEWKKTNQTFTSVTRV